ncbi:hypothetical protein COC60_06435 [Bacillus thuringiensis]|uniref:Crystaline entomocidal protoxin n=1 Tax=Bacillus thuringiensis TaxID=1428 RepID=A0ABD6SIA6_BACTU|nr:MULTISPECIES: hypothetical protein [Bacillus cereus group]PEU95089.1 hypothetical protein CN409_20235 [Bacillus sp. AFS012607]PGB56570.1 hypothetical protein COL95_03285 [Bacillus anthracis]KIZ30188.1 hypothetical protein SK30_11865 [Bacillus cereus]PEF29420.1 hypothetical protein CON39_16600 [Bacillus thuringiensis]PES78953.1 hypothetical protein CN511_25015 [Bacillus thuringiensis]
MNKFTTTSICEIIKYAHDGGPDQLNNTARSIVIAGTDFIPYGGIYIFQLLNAVWPEKSGIKSQLNALNAKNSQNSDDKTKNQRGVWQMLLSNHLGAF